MLPASIETVLNFGVLYGRDSPEILELFRGLPQLKQSRVPKLKVFTFERMDMKEVGKKVWAACKDTGITLAYS